MDAAGDRQTIARPPLCQAESEQERYTIFLAAHGPVFDDPRAGFHRDQQSPPAAFRLANSTLLATFSSNCKGVAFVLIYQASMSFLTQPVHRPLARSSGPSLHRCVIA